MTFKHARFGKMIVVVALVAGTFMIGYALGYRKNLENAKLTISSGSTELTYSSAQESHSVSGTVESKTETTFMISSVIVTNVLTDISKVQPKKTEVAIDGATGFFRVKSGDDGSVAQKTPASMDDVKPGAIVTVVSEGNMLDGSSVHAREVDIME